MTDRIPPSDGEASTTVDAATQPWRPSELATPTVMVRSGRSARQAVAPTGRVPGLVLSEGGRGAQRSVNNDCPPPAHRPATRLGGLCKQVHPLREPVPQIHTLEASPPRSSWRRTARWSRRLARRLGAIRLAFDVETAVAIVRLTLLVIVVLTGWTAPPVLVGIIEVAPLLWARRRSRRPGRTRGLKAAVAGRRRSTRRRCRRCRHPGTSCTRCHLGGRAVAGGLSVLARPEARIRAAAAGVDELSWRRGRGLSPAA